MQRSPPAHYLAINIFMWGALLMAQTAVNSFGALAALRVLSGAFEAIADPAFMLITSMYYTRSEQPARISAWYVWNGVGVAGGGLIGKEKEEDDKKTTKRARRLTITQATGSAISKVRLLPGAWNS